MSPGGGAKIEHPPKVCICLLKTAFEKGGFEKVTVLVGNGCKFTCRAKGSLGKVQFMGTAPYQMHTFGLGGAQIRAIGRLDR